MKSVHDFAVERYSIFTTSILTFDLHIDALAFMLE